MNDQKLFPRIGVGVIVNQNGKILLGKRKGSHGASTWAPPGGHLDFGEEVSTCAKRELTEETGLIANSVKLGPWVENIMEGGTRHYITLFTHVDDFEGSVQLLEPNKCEGWEWFSMDELPENLFEPLKAILTIQSPFF